MFTVDIPSSSNIVTVRVIDTTTRIHMDVGTMFEPTIKGHTMLTSPSYSFLIENSRTEQKVLFDLGTSTRFEVQLPEDAHDIKESGWDVKVEKNVADILQEHGVSLEAIGAIIWSHAHWDHLGDPSLFPASTDIVVGPGFLNEHVPDDIPSDFYKNRTLRELDASSFNQDIAGFPSFDYFRDGSLYLLDSPGHAIGHISALARTTTNPDTFVFLGGDISNHPGEFRPSEHLHLPALILPNPINHLSLTPCPGHLFDKIRGEGRRDSPFYGIGTWPDGSSCAVDLPAALESHTKLRRIDSQIGRVFVMLAHDENIGDVIDLFPKSVNSWAEHDWDAKAKWMFLKDFKDAVVKVEE